MANAVAPQNTQPKPSLPGAFELFKPSWEAVKINASPIIVFMALTLILSVALSIVGSYVDPAPAVTPQTTIGDALMAQFTPFYLTSNAIVSLISVLVAPGLTIALLKAAKGESIGVLDAFKSGLKIFWRYFGLTLLTGLIIAVGLILFIVPGLFMAKRYLLAPYYLVDRNLSIGEALKASAADAKRNGGAVWGVLGVIILFGIITVVPIIGWIIGIAGSFAYLAAPAIRYLQFKEINT